MSFSISSRSIFILAAASAKEALFDLSKLSISSHHTHQIGEHGNLLCVNSGEFQSCFVAQRKANGFLQIDFSKSKLGATDRLIERFAFIHRAIRRSHDDEVFKMVELLHHPIALNMGIHVCL